MPITLARSVSAGAAAARREPERRSETKSPTWPIGLAPVNVRPARLAGGEYHEFGSDFVWLPHDAITSADFNGGPMLGTTHQARPLPLNDLPCVQSPQRPPFLAPAKWAAHTPITRKRRECVYPQELRAFLAEPASLTAEDQIRLHAPSLNGPDCSARFPHEASPCQRTMFLLVSLPVQGGPRHRGCTKVFSFLKPVLPNQDSKFTVETVKLLSH